MENPLIYGGTKRKKARAARERSRRAKYYRLREPAATGPPVGALDRCWCGRDLGHRHVSGRIVPVPIDESVVAFLTPDGLLCRACAPDMESAGLLWTHWHDCLETPLEARPEWLIEPRTLQDLEDTPDIGGLDSLCLMCGRPPE